jgi:ubiquitin carboxyl-terminal hydrolase 4/11/15
MDLETTDAQTEKKTVKGFLDEAEAVGLVEGDYYYLISSTWWLLWKRFVGYDESIYSNLCDMPRPGPIDNHTLVEENGELKHYVTETYHFMYLPKTAWEYLHGIYGGGPEIARLCVTQRNSTIIELRKLKLSVIWSRDPKNVLVRSFGKSTTVEKFLNEMRKEFRWNPKKIRFVDFYGARKVSIIPKERWSRSLEDCQIMDNQQVLIEEKKRDGSWPDESIYKHLQTSSHTSHYNLPPSPAGQTGLSNLGNTCFMNSALQCLSATAPLTDFFLDGSYQKDINTSNPLGMSGEMATEYRNLLGELWSSTIGAYAPRDMKHKIERFAPQFGGYVQHDSQELLAFLLDGLHEDMNRILKKPPVEVLATWTADEAWDGHKKRNDSVIVDMFQGQLKSRLKCPNTGLVSNVYDPFMYLTVPLPIDNSRKLVITLHRLDPSLRPLKIGFDVLKSGSIKDLKTMVHNYLHPEGGPNQSSIAIVEIYRNKIFKEWKDDESLADISDNDDIAAYQLTYFVPKPKKKHAHRYDDLYNIHTNHSHAGDGDTPMGDETTPGDGDLNAPPQQAVDPETVRIIVFQEKKGAGYYSYDETFGTPMILTMPVTVNYVQLYLAILHVLTGGTPPEGATTAGIFKKIPPTNITSEPVPEGFVAEPGCYADNTVFEIDIGNYRNIDNDATPIQLTERKVIKAVWKNSIYSEFIDETKVKSPDVEVHASAKVESHASKKETTIPLSKCLQLFNEEEQLAETDTWYCPDCKEHVRAFKKFTIWKAPKILVIHLKRFAYYGQATRERLDHVVDFPLKDLDLSEFIEGPADCAYKYDLYAISNHFGNLGGGHYTAYCKSRNDDTWFEFDDQRVSTVQDTSSLVSSAAYVLFYKRQDVEWPAFTERTATASQGQNAEQQIEEKNKAPYNEDDYETASDEEEFNAWVQAGCPARVPGANNVATPMEEVVQEVADVHLPD